MGAIFDNGFSCCDWPAANPKEAVIAAKHKVKRVTRTSSKIQFLTYSRIMQCLSIFFGFFQKKFKSFSKAAFSGSSLKNFGCLGKQVGIIAVLP
jgi:hypothetical protein